MSVVIASREQRAQSRIAAVNFSADLGGCHYRQSVPPRHGL